MGNRTFSGLKFLRMMANQNVFVNDRRVVVLSHQNVGTQLIWLLIRYKRLMLIHLYWFCINLGGNSIPISTRCTASWLLAPLAWLC